MSAIAGVLLVLGIYLIAHAASTPGNQWVAALIGGAAVGSAVAFLRAAS